MGTATVQGDLWSGNPRDWADLQEPFFAPMYEAVLDGRRHWRGSARCSMSAAAPDCSARSPPSAARRLPVSTRREGLLAIARERTPAGDFRNGEMEELPFADGMLRSGERLQLVSIRRRSGKCAQAGQARGQAGRQSQHGGVGHSRRTARLPRSIKAMGSTSTAAAAGHARPVRAVGAGRDGADMLSKAGLTPGKADDVDAPFDFRQHRRRRYRGFSSSGPGHPRHSPGWRGQIARCAVWQRLPRSRRNPDHYHHGQQIPFHHRSAVERNMAMPRWLKRGMDASAIKAADAKVRETVEGILAQVDERKDAAIRELSEKFDKWSPQDFRLSAAGHRARHRAGAQARPRRHQVRAGASAQLRAEAEGDDARPRG